MWASGSLFIIYCHYNYKSINCKFGCCGQFFWIMNYRQRACGIQIHYNEQNVALSKNAAGRKWETTNHIGVALGVVTIGGDVMFGELYMDYIVAACCSTG